MYGVFMFWRCEYACKSRQVKLVRSLRRAEEAQHNEKPAVFEFLLIMFQVTDDSWA
jgi:hypothetical protein